jgi:hypothetical protein
MSNPKTSIMSKKHPMWIGEQEAATMLGYKPLTVRRYVKAGKLPVDYYTRTKRVYLYDRNDIEKFMLDHSTIIGRK